jgi:starch-binding outer membrane protein SusE/F
MNEMNKNNIFTIPVPGIKELKAAFSRMFTIALTGMMIFFTSCQKEEITDIKLAGELSLSSTSAEIVLLQKNGANVAVTFNWTTGTNNGTGASISYVLQIDKAGNNFASPHVFDMGKAVYAKSFTVAQLNNSLLEEYGAVAGIATNLEARVIATINTTPQSQQTSQLTAIKIIPYEPVSTTLYIFGDATANGWDASKAIPLTPDADDPTLFSFRGALGTGSYKFITELGQLLPSYNRGSDDNHIVYRTSDSEPDNKFAVAEAGVYNIKVSLLELTIKSVKLDVPVYDHIYMVGDASPNGWDIGNATELTQDLDNPAIFTYMGVMKPGDFKFPVNRNTDWGQDMFMKLTDTTMYLHHGGDPDDSKWSIVKKGHYVIRLNIIENTISISRTKLFMVGSATPIGWSVDKAIELTEDATDGCIFTYSGPMVAGEYKFPVNRNSDWGQDMYMRVDDTHMYRHVGGAADDNKWSITTAGNYVITANIETLTLSTTGKK